MKKRLLSLMLALIMVFALLPMSAFATASNDYTQWKQGDPEWNKQEAWPASKYPNATMRWMKDAGCAVTSVAMLLRHYKVVTDSNVNNFNPWICNTKLGNAGALNSAADMVWANIQNAYSGFVYKGQVSYSASKLVDLYSQGYACLVGVNGNTHWVAVKSASSTSKIVIMDPGKSNNTSLSAYGTVTSIVYFKATPKSTSYMDKCTGYNSYCTLKTTEKATLKSLPCSASTTSQSKNVATIAAGTTLTATKIYKNSAGNYWYKVKYNDKTCYIYSTHTKVTKYKTNDITISNVKKPSSIKCGSTFSVEGTVKTTYNKLAWVTGYIFPNGVAHKAANAKYSGGSAASGNSYSLKGSTVDNKLLFNKLSKGTYAYMVEAKATSYYCTDGKTLKTHDSYIVVLDSNFTVTSSSSTSSSTSYLSKCTGYASYCTLKTKESCKLYSLPCNGNECSQSKTVTTIPAGTTLTATKLYKNTANHYWYKVTYNDKTCYIYSTHINVTKYKTNDVTISNVKKPSTISKGSTFSIEGTVKTTYNKLSWVTGYIFPNNVAHKAANALYSGGAAASGNSYSLKGSTVDNKLLFNKLSKGTYAYMVEAKATSYYCTDGKTLKTHDSYIVVLDSNFTVK